MIDNLWKLIQAIENKQILTITYYKMSRDAVKRRIKPVSIMFSEYYFYLIAYMANDEEYKSKYFRIDRIETIIENRDLFTLEKNMISMKETCVKKTSLCFLGKPSRFVLNFQDCLYRRYLTDCLLQR